MWKNGLQNVNGPAFTQFAFYSLEDEKNSFCQPKKGEKIATLGSAFLKAEWKSPNKNRGVRRTPPTHGHPKRGWPLVKTLGCIEAPNFEGKRFSFFGSEKAEFSTRAAQDIPQKNRSKIGFSVTFPFWKKEKKEKKRIGLVFNLWETHKGTNVGPAKKWLGEVPFFGTPHKFWWSRAINVLQAFCTWCELFVKE